MKKFPEREIMPDPNNCFYVLRNQHGAATCRVQDGRPVDLSSHRAVRDGDAGARPCEFVGTGFCVTDGTSLPPIAAGAAEDAIYKTLYTYLPTAKWPIGDIIHGP